MSEPRVRREQILPSAVGTDVLASNVEPLWVACVQRFDHAAIGSDQMYSAMPITTAPQLFSMLLSVVCSTERHRVRLVGRSTVDPRRDVVDIAKLRKHIAASKTAPNRQQLSRLAGLAGKQAARATHVDDHIVRINDNAADAALEHCLQRNIGEHRHPGARRATSSGGVNGGQIGKVVGGEIEKAVASKYLQRCRWIDHQVDERLGSLTVSWRRRCRHHDLVHRIEATLVSRPRKRMRQSVTTELGTASIEVFASFDFDCKIEDSLHLGRLTWGTTGGMNRHGAIVDANRGCPLIFVESLIGKGAVLVSLNHEMFDDISEVVVLEPFSLFDKECSKVCEPTTSTRMLLSRRHRINLADRNPALAEDIADLGMLVEQPSAPLDAQSLRARAVQLLLQIPTNRTLCVLLEKLPRVDDGSDRRYLQFGFVAQTFCDSKGSIEIGDRGVRQVIDPCFEHVADCTCSPRTFLAV